MNTKNITTKDTGVKKQMTVRLRPEVQLAAEEVQRRTNVPLAVIIADAATETLLPSPRETPEKIMQNASLRILSRIEALERALSLELCFHKEFFAQFARLYLNHTPTIPEAERVSASLSGRTRFARLVDQVNRNIRDGLTILTELESNDAKQ